MDTPESCRTTQLIEESRQVSLRIQNVADDLDAIRKDAATRISFLKWWRFLDFDPVSAEFLRKLDMSDDLVDQLITRE
jgi:hypothetical protein